MKELIKQIIYKHSVKGGMCEDINEGQIIGIKTGVELDIIASEIEKQLKSPGKNFKEVDDYFDKNGLLKRANK